VFTARYGLSLYIIPVNVAVSRSKTNHSTSQYYSVTQTSIRSNKTAVFSPRKYDRLLEAEDEVSKSSETSVTTNRHSVKSSA
jgi:hypothetical protein